MSFLDFLVSTLDFPLGREAFPPVFCTIPGTLGTSVERSVISPGLAAGRKGPVFIIIPCEYLQKKLQISVILERGWTVSLALVTGVS